MHLRNYESSSVLSTNLQAKRSECAVRPHAVRTLPGLGLDHVQPLLT